MGLTPKDMDFIEAKNAASRDIALAFGVPPMLLGIPGDNTYANYQEANRAFYRMTVLPLVARTAKELSAWLAPLYGAGAEALVRRRPGRRAGDRTRGGVGARRRGEFSHRRREARGGGVWGEGVGEEGSRAVGSRRDGGGGEGTVGGSAPIVRVQFAVVLWLAAVTFSSLRRM